MNLPSRVRPRALATAFALAALLGVGPGFLIGRLLGDDKPSSAAEASASTKRHTQITSANLEVGEAGPETPAPVGCQFREPEPDRVQQPVLVAGVTDGGMNALADAFDVADGNRLSVERADLASPSESDMFAETVIERRKDGASILLVQEGPNQFRIAHQTAAEGVVVVVVFAAPPRDEPLAAYPSGTLGVFTQAKDDEAAVLTFPMAKTVVKVLRGETSCPNEATEGD